MDIDRVNTELNSRVYYTPAQAHNSIVWLQYIPLSSSPNKMRTSPQIFLFDIYIYIIENCVLSELHTQRVHTSKLASVTNY